ncbi:HAD family hydrolase [Roseobacter sinensis]|uniref:phosphoglycolate phosphatase n=1 Tax=Roseobacter sinensis TaxID=2931391 RepID=A0ABT3BCB9_9RHOB|nr:HAD family hydrolase [Roseobacter sp. WL0113]MCV3271210.1 HAD family hydrolase [Roseobacter sp. WL0113]
MRPVRGVLFDKDGTLFDFAATWQAWCAVFLERIAADAMHAARLGDAIGFDYAARRFAPGSVVVAGTTSEIAAALLPHLPGQSRSSLLTVMNAEAARAPQVEAAPLVPLLGGLRQAGLRLGVATNDSEAPARAHLDRAGILHLFDFIAGFDSGHGGKPAPGQLLAFADAVGLPVEEIVMVGDSTHDLEAGRAAGMRCVGVLTGLAGRDELSARADIVFDNISALPAWIAGQAQV